MEKKHRPLLNVGALLGAVVVLVFLWEFMEGGMDQNLFRLFPLFLVVVGLMIAAAVLRVRRRIKTLQRISGELGLDFHSSGDENAMRTFFDPIDAAAEQAALEKVLSEAGAHSPEIRKAISDRFAKTRSRRGLEQSVLRRLTLFREVDHPRTRNIMAGRLAEADAAVFDYTYTTRQMDPSSSTSVSQTVAAFRFRGRALPALELTRAGVLQPAGEHLDFASHPAFSKRFRLRGDDENALRTLFDSKVLSFFESLDDDFDPIVEAGGECLVVYRNGRLVRPDAVSAFVAQATAIAGALGGSRLPVG
ncbi:MAG TPA: hypothetical protein VNL91_07520 [Thermoanaerobaculia bacterium]|nr:hypothetical protein [Thermoanaerobaculia bacterium]